MEFSYLNESVPRINKRLVLLVLLATVAATFAVCEYPVYVSGIIVAVVFLAGIYSLPELGIAILVNGIYLVAFFWRGFEIVYLVTPLTVTLCAFGLGHYVFNHGLKWKFGLLPALVLFITLLVFAGILYTPLPSDGVARAGKYLSLNFFIFFGTLLFTGDLSRMENLLRILAYMGFAAVLLSIGYLGYTGIGQISRFSLPGQNPIWFSRELGMSVLATLIMIELTDRRFKRAVFVVFVILMLFVMYLTASRGPILGLLAAILFYSLVLQKARSPVFGKLVFVVCVLLALQFLLGAAPEYIWKRITNPFSGFDYTMFFRLRAFETAAELFVANPVLGVGTGGFGYHSLLPYPHNIFLEAASELGTPGLLALTCFLVCTAYLGFRLMREGNHSTLKLSLSRFFLAAFVFSTVNAQFSGAFCGNYEIWFAAAGIWALYSTEKDAPEG